MSADIGAIPFDAPGAELSHWGRECTFDAFLRKYDLHDPALEDLALIVRGADTSMLELAPECAGLYALSIGLSEIYPIDYELLWHGLLMYDAMFAWCLKRRGRTSQWPPTDYSGRA
jgi:hypothetical protein